ANKKNYIISFGFDFNRSVIPHSSTSISEDGLEVSISHRIFTLEIGGHLGFGQLFLVGEKSKDQLHIGYLLEFSAGYVTEPQYNRRYYIGLNPQMLIEYNMLLFSLGLYVDTSLFVSVHVGFGFILK
ncbi:MAG: hypothetical protein ACRCTJ_02735, partial [Brevinema sp.]